MKEECLYPPAGKIPELDMVVTHTYTHNLEAEHGKHQVVVVLLDDTYTGCGDTYDDAVLDTLVAVRKHLAVLKGYAAERCDLFTYLAVESMLENAHSTIRYSES